ncbi:MAG: terminase large subunit domain-containing protein [Bacillota bacterium]
MRLPENPDGGFIDPRRLARSLFWRGWGITQLCDELNERYGLKLKRSTVEAWKQRDKWDEAPSVRKLEDCIEVRLQALIHKEPKSGQDFKEIDLLCRQVERLARVRRYEAPGGHEGDLNPAIAARNAGEKKRKRKNHLTAEMVEALRADFTKHLFRYQEDWLASTALRTRFILKSRQIGATFYFAREALIRAFDTGNNQIFISASRSQANIFREYIVAWVMSVAGVKLEGDPIVLELDDVAGPEGEPVKLYFLGTNYRTAQGYHGDVYIDECFWIYGFEQLKKVASAMATHKRYRRTYFSTPSTIAHEAYRYWNGDDFNKRKQKADRKPIDISHDALKGGALGPDRVWRQIVTLHDAEAGGCDLFDIDELIADHSEEEFNNLYLCQFIDDAESMFPFALMRGCMVDSWDKWSDDFHPYALRPYGDGAVAIGYDPQETAMGDEAALVVVALPTKVGGKFRILHKQRFRGRDFQEQAAAIFDLMERYNVVDIGIDATGVGAAVHQLVSKRFPLARAIKYDVHVKGQMVLKAKNVIQASRLEMDAGTMLDVAQAFMAIRPELTASGRQITYVASRAGDTGHADLAWAVMHVLFNEPLDGELSNKKSTVEIM